MNRSDCAARITPAFSALAAAPVRLRRRSGVSAGARGPPRRPRPRVVCAPRATAGAPGPGPVAPGRGRVRGGLSVDFLGVAGSVATLAGVALLPLPLLLGGLRGLNSGGGGGGGGGGVVGAASLPLAVVACMSAANGLVLSRFDLHLLRRLKLTLAFGLLTRFICVPLLAHSFSLVMAAASSPAAQHMGSPAALSSLLVLSLAPVGYSPAVAMLSPFLYPTLFAQLSMCTMLLFPALPAVSYAANVLLRRLPLGGAAPVVAPPPGVLPLFLSTTFPLLLSVAVSRRLPRRWVAVGGLFALPTAWTCSALLVAASVAQVRMAGASALLGGTALCGGIAAAMAGVGLLLGALLGLDTRAKRTLVLYLSSQGSAVAAGLAPAGHAPVASVAAAMLGVVLALILSRRWSKVVVRTSGDHL